MKIEKISENQIRCTLSKADLIDRQLRLSELAYGTEKAKALFRDMMQQASYEFGFEADDIPLMIEAIPISTECLVLVITKVEDPDELDTRFSKFSSDNTFETNDTDIEEDSYADEIINCFGQLDQILDDDLDDDLDVDPEDDNDTEVDSNEASFIPLSESISTSEKKPAKDQDDPVTITPPANLTKVFSFQSLSEVSRMANHMVYSYHGINNLYKNPRTSVYYLAITKSDHTPEEFNKICNVISEYGKAERTTYASISYYNEHFEVIVKDSAIQILSVM